MITLKSSQNKSADTAAQGQPWNILVLGACTLHDTEPHTLGRGKMPRVSSNALGANLGLSSGFWSPGQKPQPDDLQGLVESHT